LTPARSSRLKKLLADTKSLSMPDQNQQINHLVARLSLGEAQASNAILRTVLSLINQLLGAAPA